MIAVLLAELGATVTLLCGIQGRRFIFSNSIFFLSQFYCERLDQPLAGAVCPQVGCSDWLGTSIFLSGDTCELI
jgi:hypothetical protein